MFSASELLIVAKALHKWTHKTKPVGIPSDQNGVGNFIMKNWHFLEVETHMIYLWIYVGTCCIIVVTIWTVWFGCGHFKQTTSDSSRRYTSKSHDFKWDMLLRGANPTTSQSGESAVDHITCKESSFYTSFPFLSLVYQTLLNQHH